MSNFLDIISGIRQAYKGNAEAKTEAEYHNWLRQMKEQQHGLNVQKFIHQQEQDSFARQKDLANIRSSAVKESLGRKQSIWNDLWAKEKDMVASEADYDPADIDRIRQRRRGLGDQLNKAVNIARRAEGEGIDLDRIKQELEGEREVAGLLRERMGMPALPRRDAGPARQIRPLRDGVSGETKRFPTEERRPTFGEREVTRKQSKRDFERAKKTVEYDKAYLGSLKSEMDLRETLPIAVATKDEKIKRLGKLEKELAKLEAGKKGIVEQLIALPAAAYPIVTEMIESITGDGPKLSERAKRRIAKIKTITPRLEASIRRDEDLLTRAGREPIEKLEDKNVESQAISNEIYNELVGAQ